MCSVKGFNYVFFFPLILKIIIKISYTKTQQIPRSPECMWLRVHEKDTPKRTMLAKVVPNIARHLLQNEIDMRNSLWHANIAAICAAYTSKRSCTLLMQPYGFIHF
jgi:hypothetical protein